MSGNIVGNFPRTFATAAAAGAASIELGPLDLLLIGGILVTGLICMTQTADSSLSDEATDGTDKDADAACVECGEIPCFPGGKDPQDKADTQAELNAQQDFINKLSPDEMGDRLDEADARRAENEAKGNKNGFRPSDDDKIRKKVRETYGVDTAKKLEKDKRAQGMSAKQAEQEAIEETAKNMKKLDAAHSLDSIVGGRKGDKIEMRPLKANRRVGASWAKKGRREALRNAVNKAKAAGKKLMDIVLKVCDE